MSVLVALFDGHEIGVVSRDGDRLSFRYEESWRRSPAGYPLSVSMPLAARDHPHARISAFLWGLLPDNEIVLSQWAKVFQVSARNPFALLSHVGEECAGAVQLVTPAWIEARRNADVDDITWLTDREVGERLRALKTDVAAWRRRNDTGQFSLAGAQAKIALHHDGQRWGVPSGRIPTTHILKPAPGGLDGHIENEHLCLELANALGLPSARSEAHCFDGASCIVVERYDRVRRADGAVTRLHQEDMCQALGRMPAEKYQNEGGPSPREAVALLREATAGRGAEDDVDTFVGALIFNWLIGGTDAHAKNYSLLIGAETVRLAPLYDIASILPYPDTDSRRARLAMKIGGHYLLDDIGIRAWSKEAQDMKLDPEAVVDRARTMARQLPDTISGVAAKARAGGLLHSIIDKMTDILARRAQDCGRKLAA